MTGEDATADRDGHGMGDERSGNAPGHRHARPEHAAGGGAPAPERRPRRDDSAHAGTAPAPRPPHADTTPAPKQPYDGSPLEALLAAAIRQGKSDGEAEQRAVVAFRAARDAGAHRARTRRRDDWRPRAQRRRVRSLRATLSVLLASLTLGGVAYAAIGSAGGGPDEGAAGDKAVRPSASASTPAESHGSARPSASTPAERPPTAKDTLAHCHAYEKLRGRGQALDSTAFRQLVSAAGGEADVDAYCAALTGPAEANGNGAGGAVNTGDTGGANPDKQQGKAAGRQNADGNKSGKR